MVAHQCGRVVVSPVNYSAKRAQLPVTGVIQWRGGCTRATPREASGEIMLGHGRRAARRQQVALWPVDSGEEARWEVGTHYWRGPEEVRVGMATACKRRANAGAQVPSSMALASSATGCGQCRGGEVGGWGQRSPVERARQGARGHDHNS